MFLPKRPINNKGWWYRSTSSQTSTVYMQANCECCCGHCNCYFLCTHKRANNLIYIISGVHLHCSYTSQFTHAQQDERQRKKTIELLFWLYLYELRCRHHHDRTGHLHNHRRHQHSAARLYKSDIKIGNNNYLNSYAGGTHRRNRKIGPFFSSIHLFVCHRRRTKPKICNLTMSQTTTTTSTKMQKKKTEIKCITRESDFSVR